MSLQNKMKEELEQKEIFDLAKKYAFEYLDSIDEREVYPNSQNLDKLKVFEEDLSEHPIAAEKILTQLHEVGALGTVTNTSGRYFGFIIGSSNPISLSTKWLTDVWDQCGGLYVTSPINAKLEVVCEKWLTSILKLPEETIAGFVSGGSMANFSAITAARYHILRKIGWDVNVKGLNGAPKIRIITHQQIHASIRKNLILLGFGDENIEYVASDDQGRMKVKELPALDNSCLVFLQAGNANTGSFDDFETICEKANQADAWVHIDGAFGLWAAATSKLSYLTKGMEKADSWVLDAHKTLNVPYDSGIVLCKHPQSMSNALQATGEYIIYSRGQRDPMLYTPEMSKRSRVFELWATMKYLGKKGIDEMVTTFHHRAKELETGLAELGYDILNEVVFNQVLVKLPEEEQTKNALHYIQQSGDCWLGGTIWNGKAAIRISISSWRTSEQDILKTIAIFEAAKKYAYNYLDFSH